MTPEEKLTRANRAMQLLDDSLLTEAFDAIERDHFENILSASSDEERARLAAEVRALRNVKERLRSVITTGKAALARRDTA
jgi:hypothetical protein